jgi:deoxyribose-phosphate aldolase
MPELPKTRADLARLIDHTLLKPETTREQIDRLCDECRQYGLYAACVNPVWVEHCVKRLGGSDTCVASVAGFPLGASLPETKAGRSNGARPRSTWS